MTIEYEMLPLAASATDPTAASYGEHIVPIGALAQFELPQLESQKCPELVPYAHDWVKWGRKNRAEEAAAWHFYTNDGRFETVLRAPELIVKTGAEIVTEVNVSTSSFDPFPVALAGLWRKRCVTRVLQDAGIKVCIDMNVEGIQRGLTLIGVPSTHELYSTKYQATNIEGDPVGIDGLYEDYQAVIDHTDESVAPFFVVYGGGKQVAKECEEHGWFHIPATSK